ncbi:MAG: rane protein [Ignavibacteria bacterium]|nr:rane protein [Ignavibacteria bacterium]
MEDVIISVVSVLTIFGSIFGIMYIFLTTRNKERMALIEKGADPMIFRHEHKFSAKYFLLKIACISIGIGIGIIKGSFLVWFFKMEQPIAYTSMIFTFAGIGLLVSFIIQNRMEKKKNLEN